jgi:hypothetical protein
VGLTGVAAQHIALVTPTKMLIIDKAENNPAKLPSGTAAHAVEYDIETNGYRALDVATNTFCSGGGFLPNGTLISAGGAEQRVRFCFLSGLLLRILSLNIGVDPFFFLKLLVDACIPDGRRIPVPSDVAALR